MITRTGTLTSGVATITGLRRTSDLQVGLSCYGNDVLVDSKILTIDSTTQVTMNKNASGSGATSIEFTTASVGVYLERLYALTDAKDIIDERGDLVQLILRAESNVDKGRYNSVKKRDGDVEYNIRAYPVEFRPSEKQLEKAGIREEADVVIWTAMKDWINNDVEFEDFKIEANRSTVILQGVKFEIKSKGLANQFNDQYLNLTFGLTKV